LVVYASLYPFTNWRDQGLSPFAFLSEPLPRYWTGFDVGINLLGYAPLGFLLALAALRSRSGRAAHAVSLAACVGALLSLSMETLQSYLPSRVPSNVDFALNALGTWLGACSASGLEKMGALQRWHDFRTRWFAADARGALVLLALWPAALLFPVSVPLGLGQVLERLELVLTDTLHDTPFLDWLPVREIELQPLLPGAEVVAVALGGLIPCLIGYGVICGLARRTTFMFLLLLSGVGFTALSAALSYGPDHAWVWLNGPVRAGFMGGALLMLVTLWLPPRAAVALALLALAVQLTLLNQAPDNPYLAQTLQIWEQGRFVRFNGLAQWLGWLWPFAALGYVLLRLSQPENASAKL
jgi:VanZ family protein